MRSNIFLKMKEKYWKEKRTKINKLKKDKYCFICIFIIFTALATHNSVLVNMKRTTFLTVVE